MNAQLAMLLAVGLSATAASPAHAASLQRVEGFGTHPDYVNMYLYVPDKPASPAPVVVATHYCTGSAAAFFSGMSGLVSAANQYGFIMIFPETTSPNSKCWDVNSSASLTHDGGSDSAAIVTMVKYVKAHYAVDASRVYAMGTSSGAMMTNVLLGAYPDVFAAGSAWSGVPFGCFAGTGWWNADCATGKISKTAQQWGDLVRAAYPGYAGPRPRVQLWHGDADTTLAFNNFGEAIKEWSNVAGLVETPSSTEQNMPRQGYTRTRYKDSCGRVRVEATRASGVGHELAVISEEVIRFFALDKNGPDPDTVGCGGQDAGVPDAGGAPARDGGAVDAGAGGVDAGTGAVDAGRGHDTDAGEATSHDAGQPPFTHADGGSHTDGGLGGGCALAGGPPALQGLAALLWLTRRRPRR